MTLLFLHMECQRWKFSNFLSIREIMYLFHMYKISPYIWHPRYVVCLLLYYHSTLSSCFILTFFFNLLLPPYRPSWRECCSFLSLSFHSIIFVIFVSDGTDLTHKTQVHYLTFEVPSFIWDLHHLCIYPGSKITHLSFVHKDFIHLIRFMINSYDIECCYTYYITSSSFTSKPWVKVTMRLPDRPFCILW